jgi:hypothetical protein
LNLREKLSYGWSFLENSDKVKRRGLSFLAQRFNLQILDRSLDFTSNHPPGIVEHGAVERNIDPVLSRKALEEFLPA